jgi:predicted transcriptional regulator
MVKKNTAVRIKEKDLAELEKLAKKEDETVSSLIRRAIREFLDRDRAKKGR